MKALAMKGVYDISSPGPDHAGRVHRTGIFRVVARLARELPARDECTATFSAAMGARCSRPHRPPALILNIAAL